MRFGLAVRLSTSEELHQVRGVGVMDYVRVTKVSHPKAAALVPEMVAQDRGFGGVINIQWHLHTLAPDRVNHSLVFHVNGGASTLVSFTMYIEHPAHSTHARRTKPRLLQAVGHHSTQPSYQCYSNSLVMSRLVQHSARLHLRRLMGPALSHVLNRMAVCTTGD